MRWIMTDDLSLDDLICEDTKKTIDKYNGSVFHEYFNKYKKENNKTDEDFLEIVNNKCASLLHKEDLRKFESGKRNILGFALGIDFIIELLKIDTSEFIEYKPCNFDIKLYEDDEYALTFNFNGDKDAKEFVQHFLKQENFSFLIKDGLKNCQEIDSGLSDAWYAFYDKDSDKYYKASPDILYKLVKIYIDSKLEGYKLITGNSKPTIKKMIKSQYGKDREKYDFISLVAQLTSLEDD